MSTISTHVLDTSLGKPAAGIRVTLRRDNSLIGSGTTDDDGRVRDLLEKGATLTEGEYTLSFSVADYFEIETRDFLRRYPDHLSDWCRSRALPCPAAAESVRLLNL